MVKTIWWVVITVQEQLRGRRDPGLDKPEGKLGSLAGGYGQIGPSCSSQLYLAMGNVTLICKLGLTYPDFICFNSFLGWGSTVWGWGSCLKGWVFVLSVLAVFPPWRGSGSSNWCHTRSLCLIVHFSFFMEIFDSEDCVVSIRIRKADQTPVTKINYHFFPYCWWIATAWHGVVFQDDKLPPQNSLTFQ